MQRSFVANKTIGTFNYPLYFEKTNNLHYDLRKEKNKWNNVETFLTFAE